MNIRQFAQSLDRVLVQLTVPQGYTLSIGGSLAVAAHRYGPPSGTQAMEYVVGALAAFVVLVLVASRLPVEPQVAGPRGGLARYNITPIFVIAAVALLVRVLPIPALGFSLAGTMAAGGYAIAVSLVDMYGRR